jgi:acetoin utilization deacetylase AcuC-like enzyme
MRTVYAEQHKGHATDDVLFEGHPYVTEEVPERAECITRAIELAGLGPVIAPSDHGLEPILAVHDAGFVAFLQSVYAESAARFGEASPVFPWTFATRYNGRKPKSLLGLAGYYAFGWGTPILEGTWEAAYWSAQCALTAADLVRAGASVAYALCRPPGHHAAADLFGGFCYLNNAAIAARYLQQPDGARVAILDIDYHHGNGTQTIFYADPTVLFCSLHAHPDDDYPYFWGWADELGAGLAEGLNRNWPLFRDTDDAAYLDALDAALRVIVDFAPEFLVVSAGFDILEGDPVGCFAVTIDGLHEIAKRISKARLPAVIVQEGGYALDRLGDSAVTFLKAFIEHR